MTYTWEDHRKELINDPEFAEVWERTRLDSEVARP